MYDLNEYVYDSTENLSGCTCDYRARYKAVFEWEPDRS